MNRTRLILSAAALLTTLVLAPAAQAQATRTWVSGVGDDVNPCSRTAPCKTFAGAISKTAAGGEISVLDPGGFGAVTITKAITINGDGTLAGILASLTNGVTINAGVNDKVVLRNISINGAGNGLSGVRYLAGKQLVLENVTIDGFTTRGVDVSMATSGVLDMRNVTITRVPVGVRLATTAGFVTATLEDVRLNSLPTNGIEATAGTFVTVRNSVISSCGTGLRAGVSGAVINAESSTLSYNATAVNAVSGATIRLSDNAIYNNTIGITFAGIVESDGTNRIQGNGSTTPPIGVILLD
jgi:hypothetical protein